MYSAADINHDEYGRCSYTLLINNKPSGTIKLSVPGVHNVYNSLSAIAACIKLGISMEAILKGLVNFTGTDRRFQKKGVFNGITVVDDYAHHPDEITATLNSAKCIHTTEYGVYSSHTHIQELKHLCRILPKHLHLQIMLYLPKYILPEKQIIWE